MTSKDEFSRDRAAIRCARATMLLYSLASSRELTATIDTAGEKEGETRREIEDLRRRLATEKKIRNRIKLCGLMEMFLLVVLEMCVQWVRNKVMKHRNSVAESLE
ncbi:hypothetical protein V5N11_011410 [Cardamine amara subsp. amara]|uniref:Uncharacterized protein n=1 Tax=Cardamine amara subsp. amara TaxID=228776 RepID=A0ABD1ABZ6_CARAN